jgi:hypothetical protein
VRDPVPRIEVGANFVVASVEVLNEGPPCAEVLSTRAERSRLSPRIGDF